MKLKRIISTIALSLMLCGAWASPSLRFQLIGLSGAPLDNAKAMLSTQLKTLAVEPTNTQVRRIFNGGSTVIKQAMQPFGYFRPRIRGRLIRQSASNWLAQYIVTPGPLLHITKLHIRITGQDQSDPAFTQTLNQLAKLQGEVFTTKTYDNKIKQQLFDVASQRGYLKAAFKEAQIKINIKGYTCIINLVFNTGPRYRFGLTNFNKNPYSEEFLRRYLPYEKGQYFKGSKLQQLQQDLSNSNYFTSVIVTPRTKKASHLHVPIEIKLIPRKARQYTFGAGYGTDTGARGLIGINLYHVTDTGHYFTARAHGSQEQSDLTAKYVIPGRKPATSQYNITASLQEQNIDRVGDSQTAKFGVAYLKSFHKWQQTIGITVQNERYFLQDNPKQSKFMIIPHVSWLKTASNHPIRPTDGYKINISFMGSSKNAGSQVDFFQTQLQTKWLKSLTRYQMLVLRSTFGYNAIDKITDLPNTLQFFTGGATSVRGYPFKDIGPGRYLGIASAELRQKIYGDFYAAAFYDVGSVTSTFLHPLKRGVGFGLVWLSPIGAVEITIAKALDKAGQPRLVQFTMGPEL